MKKSFLQSCDLLKTVGISAFAALVLSYGSTAKGQSYYSTTFDDFVSPSTLSGQDAWDTNDANQSDYVGLTPGYSASLSDYWGQLGGDQQNPTPGAGTTAGLTPVYLFRPVNLLLGRTVTFNTDMAIIRSQTPYTNNDGFAWSFRDASNTLLFSVDFVPTTTTAGAGATTYAVRYSVNGVQTSTGNGIVSDSRYHLAVSVNVVSDTLNFSLTPTSGNNPLTVTNIPLTVADANTINQVAATWSVQNLANAGSNTLIFNNYTIIPEPSTWAMSGIGALVVMVAVRRRVLA